MYFVDCLKSFFVLANATIWVLCPEAENCICSFGVDGVEDFHCLDSPEMAFEACGPPEQPPSDQTELPQMSDEVDDFLDWPKMFSTEDYTIASGASLPTPSAPSTTVETQLPKDEVFMDDEEFLNFVDHQLSSSTTSTTTTTTTTVTTTTTTTTTMSSINFDYELEAETVEEKTTENNSTFVKSTFIWKMKVIKKIFNSF